MVKKHRTFSSEFKFQVVLEILTGVKQPSEICREHQIAEGVLYRWRKEFLEKGAQVFERSRQVQTDNERIAELERVIGRLTLELSAAKKASDWLDSLL
jgi:transposase